METVSVLEVIKRYRRHKKIFVKFAGEPFSIIYKPTEWRYVGEFGRINLILRTLYHNGHKDGAIISSNSPTLFDVVPEDKLIAEYLKGNVQSCTFKWLIGNDV